MENPSPPRHPKTPRRPSASRVLVVLLELAGLVAVLGWKLSSLPRGAPSEVQALAPQIPGWGWALGGVGDLVLLGPDAGHWATAARALLHGTAPSFARPPVFPGLAAAASLALHDLVFAGHVVNHLLLLLTLVAAWSLARVAAGPGVGLWVAALVAVSPTLAQSHQAFHGSPSLHLFVLLFALGAWLALRGSLWRVVLAGGLAALCAACHHLALVFVPAVMPLMLLRPEAPARRLLSAGVFVLAAWAGWRLLMLPYDGVTIIAPLQLFPVAFGSAGGAGYDGALSRDLLGAVRLSGSFTIVWQALRDPGWTPLHVLLPPLLLVGLGAPSVGVSTGPGDRRWRTPLLLAVLLLPVLGIAALGGEARYGFYGFAIIWIGAGRGLGCLGGLLDRGLRARWLRWPVGAPGLLTGGLLAGLTLALSPPDQSPDLDHQDALHSRQVGSLLEQHMAWDSCLAASIFTAEASFYAGLPLCGIPACVARPDRAFDEEACGVALRSGCRGASVPYKVELRAGDGIMDRPPETMDRWVKRHGRELGQVESRMRHSVLYAIPCDQGPQ
jgi:nitrate reductase NapE component